MLALPQLWSFWKATTPVGRSPQSTPASSLPLNCSFQQGIFLRKASSVVRMRQYFSIVCWCLAESFDELWGWKQFQMELSTFCHSSAKKENLHRNYLFVSKEFTCPCSSFLHLISGPERTQTDLTWPDFAKEEENIWFLFSSSELAPCP